MHAQQAKKIEGMIRKMSKKKKTNESEEMDERTLSKSQQDRLDDLEAYLGHLLRLRTPRTAEIDATKKKIKKLKSEFEPDDLDESWSINEMTGINVPELIRTTVHRLTHPHKYTHATTHTRRHTHTHENYEKRSEDKKKLW